MRLLAGAFVALAIYTPAGAQQNGFSAGPPPETPTATQAEMVRCLGPHASDRPWPPLDAVLKCEATVQGMTAGEYLSMAGSCMSIDSEAVEKDCVLGIDAIRPLLSDAPKPMSVSAAQLEAIEATCARATDPVDAVRCKSGVRKLKHALLSQERP